MTARIDLHVHSKYSSRPSQWILQKIGCPECFTEPLKLYQLAKVRNMTHVTITDHNRIDGALEIAHLPDAFVSEEITTYFPEDKCKIHVLALNITEKQHKDIQNIRENIYDLVDFLIEIGITHIVAHPLYSVNGRLTIGHFEKLLLLFKNFEMNGARNDSSNDTLKRILGKLNQADIDRLANTHDIEPRIPKAWEKNLTGGSDDHSSLNIARTFTEIQGADSLVSALRGIYRNQAKIIRRPSSPLSFAHNLYGIAYQYYRNKLNLERYAGKDALLDFVDHCLQPGPAKNNQNLMAKLYSLWHYRKRPPIQSPIPKPLTTLIRKECGRLLYDNPDLMKMASAETIGGNELEEKWFEFVNQTSNRMTLNFARNLMNHLAGANVFNIFQTIGEVGGLYAMVVPYLISFSYFSQDRVFNEKIISHFKSKVDDAKGQETDMAERIVAHFTDQTTPSQLLIEALKKRGTEGIFGRDKLTILACGRFSHPEKDDVHIFQPVGTYKRPEFPDHKLLFPPLMEMLNYCYLKGFTHIHSATLGPVGLAALGVALILRIPVYGTYHQSPGDQIPFLGNDESSEEVIQRFMTWYYNQLDRIYISSDDLFDHLSGYGVKPEKIVIVPQEIATQHLTSARSNRRMRYADKKCRTVRLIFAGPATRESNLPLLAEVFKILWTHRKNLHFDLIGDGPYLDELKGLLNGYPCTFYGQLSPAERTKVYAKGSIFVWPCADTKDGHYIQEAQAHGLPIILSNTINSESYVTSGLTGHIFRHNDATNFYEVLLDLIDNHSLRNRKGISGRRYLESLALDAAILSQPTVNFPPIPPKKEYPLSEAV